MKKYFFLFIFILLSACSSDETTTYYLIRHSEKNRTDKSNNNPDLNEKGKERAKKWAAYFTTISLNAVYATNYNRTQQTAMPTAKSKKLEILSYNPKKMYNKEFQKKTKGKKVLIVGHSNTTPQFVNKILGEKKYSSINDSINSNLYIVTIKGENKTSKLLTIR